MALVPLSRATLRQLPSVVRRPAFDPSRVRPGIVHLGLGGFHRAHMARYTHDLMERDPAAMRWGIIGVGLMPGDRAMHAALAPQDNLYTLVEQQGDERTITAVGSICQTLFAGESTGAALAAIADPATRIVSLTVTQHGYCLNAATRRLDLEHPIIAHDLDRPRQPKSAIAILVEGYRRRREAGLPPFTALSCDNIEHNGRVLRDAVLAFAATQDAALAEWIAEKATFPSTMVDRITPLTSEEQKRRLADETGVADRWPVFCEAFRQWVVEDDFVGDRPDWSLVGAQFVRDVLPYEQMKLRLLNASHLAIAGLGRLLGYTHVDEAMRDEALRGYMRALMDRETGPTVPPVPGVDLPAYKATLIERFANPSVKDTVERVNTDAPVAYLLDPLRDRLTAGAPAPLLALALAAWMRRVRGEDEQGRRIAVIHPLADLLRARALEGGPDPRPLLSITSLFGDLRDNGAFVTELARQLAALYGSGARATLAGF